MKNLHFDAFSTLHVHFWSKADGDGELWPMVQTKNRQIVESKDEKPAFWHSTPTSDAGVGVTVTSDPQIVAKDVLKVSAKFQIKIRRTVENLK